MRTSGARRRTSQCATQDDEPTAIALYSEAVRLDPNYALAFASRSLALSQYASNVTGHATRDARDEAQADARRAIVLAPELGEGHLALGFLFGELLDFRQAITEYERALALTPGNARVLRVYGLFAVEMGRTDAGIAAVRRAAILDPLVASHVRAQALFRARRYDEALTAYQDVIALEPYFQGTYASRGIVYYTLEDLSSARSSCEAKLDDWVSQWCLAIVYDKLGRHADAENALARVKASEGDSAAYQYAEIYAQWGDRQKALEWLDTAMRLRDPDLVSLKTDPLLDPLRKEPRFQAILRRLNFPD